MGCHQSPYLDTTAAEKKRKNAHLEAEAGRDLCCAGPSPGSPRPKSLPAALADPAGRGWWGALEGCLGGGDGWLLGCCGLFSC